MAGFYALADPNESFNLDLDNELEGETLTSCIDPPDRETDFHCHHEDAKWYSREEVLAVLNNQGGDPPFKLPPRNALAGALIRDWANGKVVVGQSVAGSVTHGQDAHDANAQPFRNFF